MTQSEERDALHDLLNHPMWQALHQWAETEWMTRHLKATEACANETDDIQALGKLRQVIAAKKAVELVLQWPRTRLKELERTTTEPPMPFTRGGR